MFRIATRQFTPHTEEGCPFLSTPRFRVCNSKNNETMTTHAFFCHGHRAVGRLNVRTKQSRRLFLARTVPTAPKLIEVLRTPIPIVVLSVFPTAVTLFPRVLPAVPSFVVKLVSFATSEVGSLFSNQVNLRLSNFVSNFTKETFPQL